MIKSELIALLKDSAVEVVFIKKNGDIRSMICTLNDAFLPDFEKTDNSLKPDTDLVTVWDLEANGWRSFNFAQVLEVEYDDDEGSCVRWKRL